MFYHPNENKLTLAIKHFMALFALLSMIVLFVYVVLDDFAIKQEETVITIDVKNKVNICLPEDDEIFEESFFSF